MKRVILVVLALLTPIGAMAQVATPAGDQRAPADSVRAAAPAPAPAAEPAAPIAPADQSTASIAQKPAPPAARPSADERRPRRRGSMVGYIEDPVVSSKVRIRFDAATHNEAPDRAEFFYAKCGCYRDLGKTDARFDASAPGPGPGIVTNLNFQQMYAYGEYAVNGRFSFFGELPVRWIQPQSFVSGTGSFESQSGISDLRAGVKLGLADSDRQVVSVQLRAFLPTGKASSGMGTDHASLEPTLLLYHQVTDRFSIESQIGDWHPFGGSNGVPTSSSDHFAGDVFFYGIGPSYELYRGDRVRFAPVVELVGWHVLDGFLTVTPPPEVFADAGGTNIVSLKIGARTSWNGQGSFYVGYGHALTKAAWYDNIVRFEYRRSF